MRVVQIFPVFYVLTTNRTNECYTAVFQYIDQYIFKMEPDEIITDFEAALRLSINNCFPDTILRGCWYHYCASVRRRFAVLGLNSLLKKNAGARLVKKEIQSLPLLPADKFDEGVEHIMSETQQFGLSNDLRGFFAYFNYWIEEVMFSNNYSMFSVQHT